MNSVAKLYCLRISAARRESEHSKLLESINDRLQTTVDGAWKIFGRVIAPQSLIQLRIELDAVRQQSERIVAGEEIDANDLEALTGSENTFMATFANNAARLAPVRRARIGFSAPVLTSIISPRYA